MFPTHLSDSSANGHLPLQQPQQTARRDSTGTNTAPYQQQQQLHLAQQQQQQGMVNLFPTQAGHQLDLNHLWQQVQELSAILAANRESTVGLVRRADEIRRYHGGPRGKKNRPDLGESGQHLREGVNGAVNGTREVDLEAQNLALRNEITGLRAENEDLSQLVHDYETVLEKVLEGLQVYARDHAASTINIHQTYTNQLAFERSQNAQLRQNETDNQMRLATISKLLREAYQHETALEPDVLVEGPKVENEVLREALGLPNDFDGVEGGDTGS